MLHSRTATLFEEGPSEGKKRIELGKLCARKERPDRLGVGGCRKGKKRKKKTYREREERAKNQELQRTVVRIDWTGGS